MDLLRDQIDFVRTLAEISSGTSNTVGVNRVQKILAERLERLGFRSQLLPNPDSKIASGDLLVATLPGEDPRYITFVSHGDTLDSADLTQGGFQVDETRGRLIGQGVLDDKASQVVAVSGIEAFLRENKSPRYSLRFVSSPSEEAGSTGFHGIFRSFAEDSVMILGFEPSMEDGSIIESRRGNRWYHVKVEGREAHSGRAHDQGANAAHELAIKIARIHSLTDYKRGVTVSVGHLSGGHDLYNVVCGHAEAKLDTRFNDLKSRDRLHEKIEKILRKTHVKSKTQGSPTFTIWNIVDDCPPFSMTRASKTFVREYLAILSKLENRRIRSVCSGGAADSCYMSRPGLVVIDGLGATGGCMHRPDEYATLESLASRAVALTQFLAFAQRTL